MGKKCSFSECDKKESWSTEFYNCEYCGNRFCSQHIHWENHYCDKGLSKWSDEKLKKEIERNEKEILLTEIYLKSKDWEITDLLLIGPIGTALQKEGLRDKIMKLKKKIVFYNKELKRRGNKI